jgi:hypothetical protein
MSDEPSAVEARAEHGSNWPEIFDGLLAPFDRMEVKSRAAQGGRILHYLTARSVMNRLDEVLGPENWWDNYEFFGSSGCKCFLTLRLPNGREVTKVGVGGVTAMPDDSDTDKTGESDSLKRAAAKFGVGRYLYGDGTPNLTDEPAPASAPSRPAPAAGPAARGGGGNPSNGANTQNRPAAAGQGSVNANGNAVDPGWPKTGKGLHRWAGNLGAAFKLPILAAIDETFVKGYDWPQTYGDWKDDQVEIVRAFVAWKLRSKPNYDGCLDKHMPTLEQLKGDVTRLATELLVASGMPNPPYGEVCKFLSESQGQLRLPHIATQIGDPVDCQDGELLENLRELFLAWQKESVPEAPAGSAF